MDRCDPSERDDLYRDWERHGPAMIRVGGAWYERSGVPDELVQASRPDITAATEPWLRGFARWKPTGTPPF